jgi:hypothetical protein
VLLRVQAIVRLRNVLISAMRRHPHSPHIPKSLIRRLCDEYERADTRCVFMAGDILPMARAMTGIDWVFFRCFHLPPLFGRVYASHCPLQRSVRDTVHFGERIGH